MLTILGLMAGLALPHPSVSAPIVPVQATQSEQDPVDRLWQVLDLGAIMTVLRDEAVAEATRMEAEGLIEGSGPPWPVTVARIHATARLETGFRAGVAGAIGRVDPAMLDRALRFHASDLGRRVVALEVSARRAMLEDGVDGDARAAFDRADAQGLPRAAQIRDLIARGDLIAPNVAGGLNAAIAFSRGFAEGGGFDMPPTPQQMMADAWAQRDQIEAEATAWLQGFLMLAYAPLSDAELAIYADHAASAEGKALSQLLFAGFDHAFGQVSRDMGLAAALRLQGQQL